MHHEVYDKLADFYRLVGDAHFLDLLMLYMTPEDGKYILELLKPATPAEVAQKLNLDEKTVAVKLDNLARRGLLLRGKAQYMAWGSAHQLNARVMFSAPEYTPRGLIELRQKDERYTTSPYAEINSYLKMYERTGKPLGRVMPALRAIAANPEIKPEQVLWYENIAEMLKRAEKIGVVPCDCRRIYGRCGKPELTCFHIGNMVDYEVGRGGRMKRITAEEAINIIDECEVAGLVHNAFNNAALPGVLCQCCSDCCSSLEPAIQSGRLMELVAPSRYQARVKQELCKGCQQCQKRCPFGAIEMIEVAGGKKPKAKVNKEKCLGCGVCVVGCKQKAMIFELVRPPDFIPPKPDFGRSLAFSVL